MKKMLLTILLASASVCAHAQLSLTNTSAPPSANELALETPQAFLTTAVGYVSSFNTNYNFTTNSQYEVWTGVSYQSGVNLGAVIGAEAKPFKSVPWLMLGEVSTLAPQVGTIATEEIDLGYSAHYIDTEFSFGLCGVDKFHADGLGYPAGLRGGALVEIKKDLSANTYAGVRLNETFGKGHGEQPPCTFFAGFKF